MSDLEPVPDGVELLRGEATLAEAARQLSVVAQPRAVEIAGRVLERALAAPRRGQLVRAAAPRDHLVVSTVALTTLLRARLDADLDGAAVGRVVLDVDRDEQLSTMTVELYVQYGRNVLDLADQARVMVQEVLEDTLGPGGRSGRPGAEVVVVTHVHASDVTVGDPHLVDPVDEAPDAPDLA